MYQLCISGGLRSILNITVYNPCWYVYMTFASFCMVLMDGDLLHSIFRSAHLRIAGGEIHLPMYHPSLQSHCGSFQYRK